MKLPKELQRYCPYCRKHTKQTLAIAKQKSRSSAHPLSRSSTARLQARGLRVGYGNQGRFSKKGGNARLTIIVSEHLSIQEEIDELETEAENQEQIKQSAQYRQLIGRLENVLNIEERLKELGIRVDRTESRIKNGSFKLTLRGKVTRTFTARSMEIMQ